MRPADNVKRLIKNLHDTTSTEMDERVLGDILRALNESEKTSALKRRQIMKSPITKLAAAAVIVIAVFLGLHFIGEPDLGNVAWGELVERVERSHDEYMEALLLATEEKDTEKINFYADLFSDFWQRLGWLARAKLDPEFRIRMSAIIAEDKARCDERETGDQIGIRIFLEYADQFSDWLGKIKDVTWINEAVHVCKQMEEYAEEIRDGARDPELSVSHIEHCVPSFITYCEWFEQLPWDNPEQDMNPAVLLAGIRRDLQIARREMDSLEIFDADRHVRRCTQQARKNVLELSRKIESSQVENQWELCVQLTQRIDELCDLIAYAQIARWEFLQTAKAYSHSETYQAGIAKWRAGQYPTMSKEVCHHILTKEFGNKASFADYFIERTDLSLDLCKKLLEELASMQ